MSKRPIDKNAMHLPLYEADDQVRLETWLQLTRTFYRLQKQIVALLSERDLTLPQFDVMATLRYSEGVTQQELAERLLVTKGNVCGVLDRLEAMGWVERRSDPKDRRTNRLHLTGRGKTQIGAILPLHDALVIRSLAAFKSSAIRDLRQALITWDAALGDG